MSTPTPADREPRPMSARQVRDYLSARQITIVITNGRPALRPPPDMPREWFEAHVSRVGPSLTKHRDEILADLQAMSGTYSAGRKLTSAEVRAAVFAKLAEWITNFPGARVGGYCGYDKLTHWLDAGATEFPRHWTGAAVCIPVAPMTPRHTLPGSVPVSPWYDLPGARPPAGWKVPNGWTPTPLLQPPVGWSPPKANRQREARKNWAARWKTQATWKDTLPPD